MDPVIPEIIYITDGLSRGDDFFKHRVILIQHISVSVMKLERADRQIFSGETELMQVRAIPSEKDLEYTVQHSE